MIDPYSDWTESALAKYIILTPEVYVHMEPASSDWQVGIPDWKRSSQCEENGFRIPHIRWTKCYYDEDMPVTPFWI